MGVTTGTKASLRQTRASSAAVVTAIFRLRIACAQHRCAPAVRCPVGLDRGLSSATNPPLGARFPSSVQALQLETRA